MLSPRGDVGFSPSLRGDGFGCATRVGAHPGTRHKPGVGSSVPYHGVSLKHFIKNPSPAAERCRGSRAPAAAAMPPVPARSHEAQSQSKGQAEEQTGSSWVPSNLPVWVAGVLMYWRGSGCGCCGRSWHTDCGAGCWVPAGKGRRRKADVCSVHFPPTHVQCLGCAWGRNAEFPP